MNELVNLPDILGMEIAMNGEVFSLSREAWQRELDFASGELRRSVVWRTSNGTGYAVASRGFVRQTNCRSLCWKSLLRHWTPTRQC
ncbi:hypothetical protein ACLBOM_20755 [Escherichia coli]